VHVLPADQSSGIASCTIAKNQSDRAPSDRNSMVCASTPWEWGQAGILSLHDSSKSSERATSKKLANASPPECAAPACKLCIFCKRPAGLHRWAKAVTGCSNGLEKG
jgi:hypothetical protein